MEKKGLRMNMGKTKLMVIGSNLKVLRKSGKYPCGVCQAVVGRNAIQCGGCRQWVYMKCSGIKGPLISDHFPMRSLPWYSMACLWEISEGSDDW